MFPQHRVHMLELSETQRRGDIVHMKLVAEFLDVLLAPEVLLFRLPIDAIPAQQLAPSVCRGVPTNEGPPVDGRQMLDGLKGEADEIGVAADGSLVIAGPEGMGRVFDHLHVILAADPIELIKLTGIASPMHRHDGLGLACDFPFHIDGVDVSGHRIDVGPDDRRAHGHDGNVRCGARHGRRYHLVTRPHIR